LIRVPVLLMVREPDLGGSERQLTEIARTLDRRHFAVHVGCFRGEGLRAGELRAAGVPITVFPVRSLLHPSTFAVARELGRYLRRNEIRLVHAFDTPSNLFAVPVARAFGTPVVLASQRAYRDLTPGIHRNLLRLTDQIADGIVVNCEAMRRHLIEDERVPRSRIQICPNGVDTKIFFARERGPRAHQVIGLVSALRPEKGIGTLLRAVALVRGRLDGVRLSIVGDGPERGQLETLAAELGLGEACRFDPAKDCVAERLEDVDIFVLPSLSEALSNSLMEAMACGCAVVASRTGGNIELVAPDQTGLLFEPGNAADLAVQISRLIEEPALRTTLAANAAKRIREEYSLERATDRMAAIYETYLGVPGVCHGVD
jgi:glycosyltransferase involved in cell wall biosynthesis